MLLVLAVGALAIGNSGTAVMERGLWMLLPFTMQMALEPRLMAHPVRVPEDVVMALELLPDRHALGRRPGTIRYHPAFAELQTVSPAPTAV